MRLTMEPKMSGDKYCPKCDSDKHVLHFAVNKKRNDGLAYWCRECQSQYKADKKHSLPNKTHIRQHIKYVKRHRFNI